MNTYKCNVKHIILFTLSENSRNLRDCW